MGQQEVINFLLKQKNPLSRSDIAKGLKINKMAVSKLLARLVKFGEVDYIEIDRVKAMDMTKEDGNNKMVRRRMRLFYALK